MIDYAIVNEETWERVGKFRIEEREYTRTISKWLRGSKGKGKNREGERMGDTDENGYFWRCCFLFSYVYVHCN
jgi:hypothetical protein